MKSLKYLAISAAIISAMAVTSCKSDASKADKQLAELAAASTTADPSVTYKAKTLTYRYTVDPATYARINADNLRAKTFTELTSASNARLVKTLAEAGAKLHYVYVCDNDSISFSFKPSELTPAK